MHNKYTIDIQIAMMDEIADNKEMSTGVDIYSMFKKMFVNDINSVDNAESDMVDDETVKIYPTVMTYNIYRSAYDSKIDPQYTFDNRACHIKKIVDDISANIVCFQECRNFPKDHPTKYGNIRTFLNEFENYDYELFKSTHHPYMSKNVVTMWDPKVYYKKSSVQIRLSEFNVMGGVLLCRVIDGSLTDHHMWVFNIHLDIKEDVRAAEMGKIAGVLSKLGGRAIFAGDFNTYNECKVGVASTFDQFGYIERDMILESTKNSIDKTYCGCPHEKFKAPRGQLLSRLDHIFYRDYDCISSTVIDRSINGLNKDLNCVDYQYPSDHLPVFNVFIETINV